MTMQFNWWTERFLLSNMSHLLEKDSCQFGAAKQVGLIVYGIFHKAAELPMVVTLDMQAEEEFKDKPASSGHDLGSTDEEEPKTSEPIQDVNEPALMDKEILDKQMEVNGDSLIPVKFPATVMLLPTTSCKVM